MVQLTPPPQYKNYITQKVSTRIIQRGVINLETKESSRKAPKVGCLKHGHSL